MGSAIQMIPVDEVLFFISDEKYTRVQTATVEALIRKPIKELVDELDPQRVLADPPLHAGQRQGHRRRAPRRARAADRQRASGHPQKLEVSRSYAGLFKGM